MRIRLEPYTPAHAPAWNAWVAGSRNGTFLFDRGFMDYHADRFEDASLMAYDGARLVAALPAHRDGDRLVSHAGLSYGGFVLGDGAGQRSVLALFDALLPWMGAHGLSSLRGRKGRRRLLLAVGIGHGLGNVRAGELDQIGRADCLLHLNLGLLAHGCCRCASCGRCCGQSGSLRRGTGHGGGGGDHFG